MDKKTKRKRHTFAILYTYHPEGMARRQRLDYKHDNVKINGESDYSGRLPHERKSHDVYH